MSGETGNYSEIMKKRANDRACRQRVVVVSKGEIKELQHVHTLNCVWAVSNRTFWAVIILLTLILAVVIQNICIGMFVLRNQSKMNENMDILNSMTLLTQDDHHHNT